MIQLAMIRPFLEELWLSFIPILVAVDAIGTLPVILTLSQGLASQERSKLISYAMLTAFGLGLAFIGIGKAVFLALGIEVADFLVAGGVLLLVLSIRHLITGKMVAFGGGVSQRMLGVVPLGTPLVVGPATLATLLLLNQQYRVSAVVLAFVLNLVLAWVSFLQATRIASLLREPGLRAASQIAMLLLAAIAVMMIRRGLTAFLG
ncbi:MAG: MarC family protein [Chloroflexota bacterium]